MANEDPLKILISNDALAINRKQVADFLHSYTSIDGISKQLIFLPNFMDLSNINKIEIILLASKARALVFELADGMTPGEIIALDVMPVGSAKSSVKNLFDSKRIKKDKVGRYFLPGYRINELIAKFSNKK